MVIKGAGDEFEDWEERREGKEMGRGKKSRIEDEFENEAKR